jgi:hypothetical protein
MTSPMYDVVRADVDAGKAQDRGARRRDDNRIVVVSANANVARSLENDGACDGLIKWVTASNRYFPSHQREMRSLIG